VLVASYGWIVTVLLLTNGKEVGSCFLRACTIADSLLGHES
jgi:hypothetical protein